MGFSTVGICGLVVGVGAFGLAPAGFLFFALRVIGLSGFLRLSFR